MATTHTATVDLMNNLVRENGVVRVEDQSSDCKEGIYDVVPSPLPMLKFRRDNILAKDNRARTNSFLPCKTFAKTRLGPETHERRYGIRTGYRTRTHLSIDDNIERTIFDQSRNTGAHEKYYGALTVSNIGEKNTSLSNLYVPMGVGTVASRVHAFNTSDRLRSQSERKFVSPTSSDLPPPPLSWQIGQPDECVTTTFLDSNDLTGANTGAGFACSSQRRYDSNRHERIDDRSTSHKHFQQQDMCGGNDSGCLQLEMSELDKLSQKIDHLLGSIEQQTRRIESIQLVVDSQQKSTPSEDRTYTSIGVLPHNGTRESDVVAQSAIGNLTSDKKPTNKGKRRLFFSCI